MSVTRNRRWPDVAPVGRNCAKNANRKGVRRMVPDSPDNAIPAEKLLDIRMLGTFRVRQGQRLIPSEFWQQQGNTRRIFQYLLGKASFASSQEDILDAVW